MSPIPFESVVPNPDLSIHLQPPAFFYRIAIVCRWKDAIAQRRTWPDVAVIGPLRTVRGIDLFVRNLLANPQIRVVVMAGPDLTPGEMTTDALRRLWRERDPGPERDAARRVLGRDLPDDIVDALIREVVIIEGRIDAGTIGTITIDNADRPSGRHVFLPPPPEKTTSAPRGDPGQRVAGETLAEIWPRALREVLDFGVEAPSKYGATKEVLGLISVIRDPTATVTAIQLGRSPFTFTISPSELEEYTRRISTDYAPAADVYSYGSRMAAQFEPFEAELTRTPDERGLFLTPWLVEDQAKPGGRPCLVGVQFRRLDDRLNLIANFRSHDFFAAYPQNLAALCLWLVRVAERHGHPVGVVQVLSVSAHLYDRDWNDARAVVEAHRGGISWDPRSTWRVEVVEEERRRTNDDPLLPVFEHEVSRHIRATALTPDGSEIVEIFEGDTAVSLRTKIEQSGLISTVGNALWLGDELAQAENILGRTAIVRRASP